MFNIPDRTSKRTKHLGRRTYGLDSEILFSKVAVFEDNRPTNSRANHFTKKAVCIADLALSIQCLENKLQEHKDNTCCG